MDMEYERKLGEMKKFIPFLENMIEHLENTLTTAHPRQAQLVKIRSLRDLLMDKTKRMKMDNLMKCKQVLINLYKRKDIITGKMVPESKLSNLNAVRNKLKSVVFKLQTKGDDTLPEIARASKTEEMCVLGSKEPALFQRRPNISPKVKSLSPSRMRELPHFNGKNNYSPRFLSPDCKPKTWINNQPEEQLFMRRPKKPQTINHRQSSLSYKKERKKTPQISADVAQPKDLNITLNVPEDRLHSLNMSDIVSRIITCSDNDVDIETLRGLRTQILGELKENGTKDDISEMIMKSYKKKRKKKKKSEEVEEGELSDSESETIENIYGSLDVIDKDKLNKNEIPEKSDMEKPCKIKICLVINSDKQKEAPLLEGNKTKTGLDNSDFESFHIAEKKNISFELNVANDQSTKTNMEDEHLNSNACEQIPVNKLKTDTKALEKEIDQTEIAQKSNQGDIQIVPRINESDSTIKDKSPSETAHDNSDNSKHSNNKFDLEIPLLNLETSPPKTDKNEVSEIDILRALKNEILNETSNVLSRDVEAPLFQPKVTKVANAQEIGYKKRISIEKYKLMTKSVTDSDAEAASKDDVLKKQSLKLTEKECERFFSSEVPFDSFSDTDDMSNLSTDDVHQNPAPKSPDHVDFPDISLKPPIIIPSDPVEMPVAISEKDIDMRKIPPPILPQLNNKVAEIINDTLFNHSESQIPQLLDPRMNRESIIINNQGFGVSVLSPNVHLNAVQSSINNCSSHLNQVMPHTMPGSNSIGKLPPNRTVVSLSPNFAPNVTPNSVQSIGGYIKSMTPSRNQALDKEDSLNLKHVYTPIYNGFETQSYKEKLRNSDWYCENNIHIPFWKDVGVTSNSDNNIPHWEDVSFKNNMSNKLPVWENEVNSWDDVGNSRHGTTQRDKEYMPYDRYYVEAQFPNIWNDCQVSSGHPFRRIDCPTTPTHPLGRQDIPLTSLHSFDGSDNVQATFGQTFKNSHNSRPYRNTDYDTYYGRDRGRGQIYNFNSHESDQSSRFNRSDSFRRFQREPGVAKSDRNNFYEQSDRVYREPASRREDGHQYIKDKEGEHFFTKSRRVSSNYEYRHHTESNTYDKKSRRYQHEKLMSRSTRDLSPPSAQSSLNVGRELSKKINIDDASYSSSTFSNNTRHKHSFIDTKKDDKSKLESRKQRSSSVERTVTCETTENRELSGLKISLNVSEGDTIRKPFRRSSSVGRDIKNCVSDFKDVKDSLKLFKINSDSKVSNYFKKQKVCDKLSRSNSLSVKKKVCLDSSNRNLNSNVKYLPTKNNRDPRMHRDCHEIKTKNKDKKISDSRDSQSCGIIYTSDNISKGIILESGQGVKNYKIPKIRRNVEVMDITSRSITDNKLKYNTENDCRKAEDGIGNENISVISSSSPNIINFANEELSNSEQQSIDGRNIIVFETANAPERRVTRSSTKQISGEKNIKTSPVRMTRKQKRTLAFNANLEKLVENSLKENNSSKNNNLDISDNKIPSYAEVDRSCSPLNILTADKECNDDERHKIENDAPIQLETINVSENQIDEKNILNPSLGQNFNVKPFLGKSDKITEKEENNSGFGIDDFETFVDNVSSEPVIDNINELIADLDDDLELNLETKLKNSNSCNDKGAKVKCEDNIISKLQDKKQNNQSEENKDVGNKNELIVSISDNQYITKQNNQSEETKNVGNKNEFFASISDNKYETKQNNQSEETKDVGNKNELIAFISDNQYDTKQNKQSEETKDMGNKNELIVSISDNQHDPHTNLEKNEEVCEKVHDEVSTLLKTSSDLTSPDSTKSDKGVPETKCNEYHPDTTDKSQSQITNCDVLSNNIETASSQIESIGKLLSILQDKSKIKEILGLLDQSDECEKIKKKLEKISEIVSDDESTNNVSEDKNKYDCQKKKHEYPESKSLIDKTTSNDNNIEAKEKETSTLVVSKEGIEVSSNIEDETINNQKEEKNTVDGDKVKTNIKKVAKSFKVKKGRKKKKPKKVSNEDKRLTRSDAADLKFEILPMKKPSRELQQIQNDAREMLLSDDVLNSNGSRMYLRAKEATEKRYKKRESTHKPVVVLTKCKDITMYEQDTASSDKAKKIKDKNVLDDDICNNLLQRSKDKILYVYDDKAHTINEANNKNDTFGSHSDCLEAFGSNEILNEIKKPVIRRRRKGWKSGIIKSRYKKKTNKKKQNQILKQDKSLPTKTVNDIPNLNCYIDKEHCFSEKKSNYKCHLCVYNGENIVNHYKKHHPHSEVPYARISPLMAKEAITEAMEVNFSAICSIFSNKYICRFCFKEFYRNKPLTESFFWHVISVHTGEYMEPCSECDSANNCPFIFETPVPCTDFKGQLLGYICEKCNYTQVSLENLKYHVNLRHNDTSISIFKINLAFMTKKNIRVLLQLQEIENTHSEIETGQVRSSQSDVSLIETLNYENTSTMQTDQKLNQSILVNKEDDNIKSKDTIQSKIVFENDNVLDLICNDGPTIKLETNVHDLSGDVSEQDTFNFVEADVHSSPNNTENYPTNLISGAIADPKDIFEFPHFKVRYSKTGSKEYICCINGNKHYSTKLLISFKKHVQLKHTEKWNGYCYACKVIVTAQGEHLFEECLRHFLDVHIDNFPVLEEATEEPNSNIKVTIAENLPTLVAQGSKTCVNALPMSQLPNSEFNSGSTTDNEMSILPVIKSVISLGVAVESPCSNPSNPISKYNNISIDKLYRYEEAQTAMMTKKHLVVLDVMMSEIKLGHVFKCAGRFCSFTTDIAEDALLHASAHARVGGEEALNCVYCDFECHQNAIDLITHVFKHHGSCQYICGMCFYRAAASQLVEAHIKRMHDTKSVAILRTSFQTASDETTLPREVAVPHYICNGGGDTEASCTFRTYTPGKLLEHLQTRHASSNDFKCFKCPTKVANPTDLIRHLKTHGLKLYQCCYCIHGADNEAEFLAHASAYHPTKLPKAYLRIVTNKEGTSEYKVLPLAHLNKLKVHTKDIVPCKVADDPVKEAERSIELEKLLGQNFLIKEPIASSEYSTKNTFESSSNHKSKVEVLDEEVIVVLPKTEFINTTVITPTLLVNEAVINNNQHPEITEDLSLEKNTEIQRNNVYCLDSDKHPLTQKSDKSNSKAVAFATKQPEIITSTVSTPTSSVEKALVNNQQEIKMTDDISPEKSMETQRNDEYPTQQNSNKCNSNASYNEKKVPLKCLFLCEKCKMLLNTAIGLKRHMMWCYANMLGPISCAHCPLKLDKNQLVDHYFEVHSLEGNIRKVSCSKCPLYFNTVSLLKKHRKLEHPNIANKKSEGLLNPKQVVPPKKRKSSFGSKEKSEPLEKTRRFGPQDVDLLPINPILDELVFCSICEFNTKVRLNMVRHLQLHAQQQPVPQTAPVNPVPHLETNQKYFDKMVNLASSSIVNKVIDKVKTNNASALLPPEDKSFFPKYVPEKHRLTCGAKGCSYISVDESMLKCHWETLHHGLSDFQCVHCPSWKLIDDMSEPLTSYRIIAHLKMHDSNLYSCSMCTFYHHRHDVVQKHLDDIHKGGRLVVVREEAIPMTKTTISTIVTTNPIQSTAPTMDLKLWHCSFCKFKSLIRLEVVNHCAKNHNSNMQYKCAFCVFNSSNTDNIIKHQSILHPDKKQTIIHCYYREDSDPLESQDNEIFHKQGQINENCYSPIKCDLPGIIDVPPLQPISKPLIISDENLDIIKKEIIEPVDETIEELCLDFGEFCDPNGLKYMCPLCKNVMEDDKEAVQSHLYEELKYRKWGCSICSYKAFHRTGLSEHMQVEHCQNREPIALQVDNRVEMWVNKLLEHQTSLIQKYKENLVKQRAEIFRVNTESTKTHPTPLPKTTEMSKKSNMSNDDLKKIFGEYGTAVNRSYCCPKCNDTFEDKDVMQNHLETELNKVRWFCSTCNLTFQTFHEAQFHCRSAHDSLQLPSRPCEAPRDPSLRNNWVQSVLTVQRLQMTDKPDHQQNLQEETYAPDASLLVVRYEEKVSTPIEHQPQVTESDEDKLVIDEAGNKDSDLSKICKVCGQILRIRQFVRNHILKHYNLKPYNCGYCSFNGSKVNVTDHQKKVHASKSLNLLMTPIPKETPLEFAKKQEEYDNKVTCLVCHNSIIESEIKKHLHPNETVSFAKKGEKIVRCMVCSALSTDVKTHSQHHMKHHTNMKETYTIIKLNSIGGKESCTCTKCGMVFSSMNQLKTHFENNCSITSEVSTTSIGANDLKIDGEVGKKRKNEDNLDIPKNKILKKPIEKLQNRQCARKSTTISSIEKKQCGIKHTITNNPKGTVTKLPHDNVIIPSNVMKLFENKTLNPIVKIERMKIDFN